MSEAVDKVRAEEARALARKGTPTIKHTRWLLLRSPENRRRVYEGTRRRHPERRSGKNRDWEPVRVDPAGVLGDVH